MIFQMSISKFLPPATALPARCSFPRKHPPDTVKSDRHIFRSAQPAHTEASGAFLRDGFLCQKSAAKAHQLRRLKFAKALTGKPLVCFVIKPCRSIRRAMHSLSFSAICSLDSVRKRRSALYFLLLGQPHRQPAAKLLPVNILQLSVCTKLRPDGDLIEFRKLSFSASNKNAMLSVPHSRSASIPQAETAS